MKQTPDKFQWQWQRNPRKFSPRQEIITLTAIALGFAAAIIIYAVLNPILR